MKKFLVLLSALTLALGLAACSSKDDAKTEKKDTNTKATAAAKKDEVKKELVKFYTDLYKTINEKDADLNSYIDAAAAEKEDPTQKIDPELKPKAAESAAAVVTLLKSVQIPAALKDQKADLEGALQDYTASYQTKADELKKDAPSFDAADATFTQGEEKLAKAFESVKLLAPSLDKQVN